MSLSMCMYACIHTYICACMRAYLHVYLSLILRWRYTVTPTQLIKKFRGLDFSELYTLSSNPAALLIDKQLFSHAVLQFHGYGTIG